MLHPTVILASGLPGNSAAVELETALADACRDAGWDVLVVPHLYHVPEQSPLWGHLAGLEAKAVVVLGWLHPRPLEWLLRRHNVRPPRLLTLNLATIESAAGGVAAIRDWGGQTAEGRGRLTMLDEPIARRWYPLVETDRCINCLHCLQFCLFGVYSVDAGGKLIASSPDSCKSGCPACSRICPQGAIMFPLYEKEPAVAGAPGFLMSPDLPARRMYYLRTGKPCTTCGQVVRRDTAARDGEAMCPECGSGKPAPQAGAAFDDLDALVDQLDAAMRRRS